MQYIQKTSTALILVCAFHATTASAEWAGFYVGINHATQTVEADWTTTQTYDPEGFEIDAESEPRASLKSEESATGLRIGYNWNLGGWVLGLEAVTGSIDHEDSIDDRIPGLGDPESDPTSFVEVRAERDDVNLRLRGGYLLTPNLLVYLTAGKIKLDVNITSTCPADTNVCNPFIPEPTQTTSNSKSLSETVVGLGVEYAINNFLLHLEYLRADLGEFSFTALPPQSGVSYGADATVNIEADTLQFGVSYGFF